MFSETGKILGLRCLVKNTICMALKKILGLRCLVKRAPGKNMYEIFPIVLRQRIPRTYVYFMYKRRHNHFIVKLTDKMFQKLLFK